MISEGRGRGGKPKQKKKKKVAHFQLGICQGAEEGRETLAARLGGGGGGGGGRKAGDLTGKPGRWGDLTGKT